MSDFSAKISISDIVLTLEKEKLRKVSKILHRRHFIQKGQSQISAHHLVRGSKVSYLFPLLYQFICEDHYRTVKNSIFWIARQRLHWVNGGGNKLSNLSWYVKLTVYFP